MQIPLSFAELPLHVLIAVPCIVLIGYTIFGATGFGSSIISVPGLAHFFPLTFTVPLITTTDAFAATSTAYRLRRLVAWREVARLLPALYEASWSLQGESAFDLAAIVADISAILPYVSESKP